MHPEKQLKELPAPLVLSYNQQGIGDVDVADPAKPIEVLVGPIDLSQRDRIDLYWGTNEDIIDTYVHSPEAPNTNGIISLYVNTRWIQAGTTDVRYTYTRFPAGNPQPSPVTRVIVKLAIPGGRDPDPATPYENEKLQLPVVNPPDVIVSPDGVSVTVKPWEHMAEGDVLYVYWHGIPIKLPPLTAGQTGHPVVVPVDRDIVIEAGDSANIVVRYEIRDLVNNWSRFSLPRYVDVDTGISSLPAPVAPQAPDMQLDLDKLAGADIQALILAHPEITSGDIINFVAERSTAEGIALPPYVESKVVGTPGSFMEFLIPNRLLLPVAQGRARFKYSVTKASGQALRSKSLPLNVLGQPQTLAPPVIPAAVDGVLDPSLHNLLTQVPPYHFMTKGDEITLVWMGRTAMGATVMYEDTRHPGHGDEGKPINFVIPDDKLRVLAGGSVEVHYTVTTLSKAFFKSPVLKLRVDSDEALPVPPPRVKEANGDILDPANAPHGATVVVEASAGLRAGDRVFVVWQGPKGYGDKDVIINETQAGKALEVVFAPHLVSDNTGESVQVVYAVYRVNGAVQRSPTLVLKIIARLGALPAPRMDSVGADGMLNPSLIPDSGARVRVSYPGMSVLDNVVLNWRGASSYDTPAQIGGGSELQFIVPKALILATVGAAAIVTYTVTRAGASTVSAALGLTVRPGLQLDASPVTLGGKVYLLPGTPDLLPDFPAGTSVQRVASGGLAPYTYRTSDERVAKVDAHGLTTVRGNGKATITVSDASGDSKHYEVTVTGVIHCVGVGKGSYSQMTAAAAANGARMPSISELKDIYAAYGNRWPMGNGNYWSSTLAAGNLVGMKWYYVKNLVTGMDFKSLHHTPSLCVAIR